MDNKMNDKLARLIEDSILLHMDVASLHRRMEQHNKLLHEFVDGYVKEHGGATVNVKASHHGTGERVTRVIGLEDIPDDLKRFLSDVMGMQVD